MSLVKNKLNRDIAKTSCRPIVYTFGLSAFSAGNAQHIGPPRHSHGCEKDVMEQCLYRWSERHRRIARIFSRVHFFSSKKLTTFLVVALHAD